MLVLAGREEVFLRSLRKKYGVKRAAAPAPAAPPPSKKKGTRKSSSAPRVPALKATGKDSNVAELRFKVHKYKTILREQSAELTPRDTLKCQKKLRKYVARRWVSHGIRRRSSRTCGSTSSTAAR